MNNKIQQDKKKRNKLGRSFFDVINQDKNLDIYSDSSPVISIEISDISNNKYQPRSNVGDIEDLKESINEYGVIQPILVRRNIDNNEKYELIVGQRRLEACRALGKTTIQACIHDYSDEQIACISIIENIQRKDLSLLDEAYSYEMLSNKFNKTHEEIAKKISVSRPRVTILINAVRKLPESILKKMETGQLQYSHIRKLVGILKDCDENTDIDNIVNTIIYNNIKSNEFEKSNVLENKIIKNNDKDMKNNYHYFCELIENDLSKDTKISVNGLKVNFKFINKKELNKALSILKINSKN